MLTHSQYGGFVKQISAIVPISKMHGRFSNLKNWLNQIDFNVMEIILVHDIQDNKTSSELQGILLGHKLEIQNKDLIIVEKFFGSPGLARNCGLDLATGNWIVFWDSDDLPNIPEYLKFSIEYPRDIDLVIGQYVVEEVGDSSKTIPRFEQNTLQEVAFNPGIWRMIFLRKSIYKNLRFERFLMGEDQLFLLNYLKPQPKFQIKRAIFYTYFVGSNMQLTSNKDAILDLKDAIFASRSTIKELQGSFQQFAIICTFRQIVTLIAKGTFATQVWAIKEMMLLILKYGRNQDTIILCFKYYFKRLGITS